MKTILKCLVVFSCLGSLLFLTNCKRNNEKEFVVKGRVVDGCSGNTPVVNAKVEIHGGWSSLPCKNEGVSGETRTDANGYFTFIYQGVCNTADAVNLVINKQGLGSILVDDIAPNQDKDLGNLSIRNNLTYKIVVETDTAYSSSDTLFYNILPKGPSFDSSYNFITGPFANNMVIDNITTHQNYSFAAKPNYVVYNRWILKNGPRVYKPDSTLYHHTTKYTFSDMRPCEPNLKAVFKISR